MYDLVGVPATSGVVALCCLCWLWLTVRRLGEECPRLRHCAQVLRWGEWLTGDCVGWGRVRRHRAVVRNGGGAGPVLARRHGLPGCARSGFATLCPTTTWFTVHACRTRQPAAPGVQHVFSVVVPLRRDGPRCALPGTCRSQTVRSPVRARRIRVLSQVLLLAPCPVRGCRSHLLSRPSTPIRQGALSPHIRRRLFVVLWGHVSFGAL